MRLRALSGCCMNSPNVSIYDISVLYNGTIEARDANLRIRRRQRAQGSWLRLELAEFRRYGFGGEAKGFADLDDVALEHVDFGGRYPERRDGFALG